MVWQNFMINLKLQKSLVIVVGVLMALVSCGGQPTQPQTLADIDKAGKNTATQSTVAETKSKDQIKSAYYDYIKDAAKDDRFRVQAATRIAELELALDQSAAGTAKDLDAENAQFDQTVRNTIRLLEDTLRDFPDAEGSDHTMYQLAKAHDQIAASEQAVAVLENLVLKYPNSAYFAEAKFRIAENAFVHGLYFKAEDAYTDVLRSSGNEVFFEKALFKRGWARYKQELYSDALDDYYNAIYRHNFTDHLQLAAAEKELFDEYFRAIGLAFTYLGGPEAIQAYFSEREEPIYVYQTYQTVANLFLKQERYSDTVATYTSYAQYYPQGEGVVDAGLQIIKTWKNAGYFSRYISSFDEFFTQFQVDADYWKNTSNVIANGQKKQAIAVIRENVVLLAAFYHNNYLKKKKSQDLHSAQKWYERYLSGYSAYARQDKIYQLYAELLKLSGDNRRALAFYEMAAFDGELILDKESAYAAIYLTDKMLNGVSAQEKLPLLQKHLNYVFLYGQLYPGDKRTPEVINHAVQLAFKATQLDRVIELANILPDNATLKMQHSVGLLKAQSYFDLQQYEDAELMYQDLLVGRDISPAERENLANKLALSIYKQAEIAKANNDIDGSARYFLRIYHEVPQSELAPAAVYDAIALFMSHSMWDEAIDYLNVFKVTYPQHPYQQEVTKKLSVAYLKSNRSLEAAREFEKLSDFVVTDEEKMAAIWQAAQLYNDKGELESALRAFKEYAHKYKRPYAQNMEAMNTITEIYQKLGDRDKKLFWLRKITQADTKASKSIKTERTQYIAANAAFAMAFLRRDDYQRIRLKNPLAQSLKAKKTAMQDAVKLFGQATVYGHEEFVTQSTLAIGEIYRNFATALIESERPRNLNAEELEQYNILLEDQAFPFEDKAIEFYETNISRIASGIFDSAIKASLENLKVLYPVRYNRASKVETLIEQL